MTMAIEDVHFDGHGCTISMASASMMRMPHKDEDEAVALAEDFSSLV